MFQQRSASDINLRGTLFMFFMFRTFFSIATAAAAVASVGAECSPDTN
jgi:hypothetical protein